MTTPTPTPPGALVISLDFELHWGVRSTQTVDGPYAGHLHGARGAVADMLELFEECGVAATWATVGFLFADGHGDLVRFLPAARPAYEDETLGPYAEPLGSDEAEDPLHFAASLVERIRDTPRQEVGTHTFSHYFCGEAGADAASFAADLAAACAIARARGVELRSIVFPRNQHTPAWDRVLGQAGLAAYRGNPHSWMWRFRNSEEGASPWRRALRLADAYLPVDGHHTVAWDEVLQPCGLSDVRASRMLRPYTASLRLLEPLRLARIRRSLAFAARERRIYHLWWHPHNFGVDRRENMDFLRGVLREFSVLRERFGMESLSMAGVDARARALAGLEPVVAKSSAGSSPTGAAGPARGALDA